MCVLAVQFQLCNNPITPTEEAWERLEIVLRFSHPGDDAVYDDP